MEHGRSCIHAFVPRFVERGWSFGLSSNNRCSVLLLIGVGCGPPQACPRAARERFCQRGGRATPRAEAGLVGHLAAASRAEHGTPFQLDEGDVLGPRPTFRADFSVFRLPFPDGMKTSFCSLLLAMLNVGRKSDPHSTCNHLRKHACRPMK